MANQKFNDDQVYEGGMDAAKPQGEGELSQKDGEKKPEKEY
jgi:hypothetical protein